MDKKYFATIYQKIIISDSILILKRVGVTDDASIDLTVKPHQIHYLNMNNDDVILEDMDSDATFMSNDRYCYGYLVALDDLKVVYHDDNIDNLKKYYLDQISELFQIAFYDSSKSCLKIFATDEGAMEEMSNEDSVWNSSTIFKSKDDDVGDVLLSLKDFKKIMKYVKEKQFDDLNMLLLKISKSVVEMPELNSQPEFSSLVNGLNLECEHLLQCDLEKLNDLVGLESVKKEVNSLLKYLFFRNKVKGTLTMDSPNLHMFFSGNPGTGKTTVARIIADILFHMGYVSNHQFAEITPKELIAGYVGQTAIKTAKFIEAHRGGVIFIDEAYGFCSSGQMYASEALVEVLKELEKNETVFIFAGYSDEMSYFMDMNPGLMSRIGYYFDYPDYSVMDLYSIFESKVSAMGFRIEDSLKSIVFNHLKKAKEQEHFGNGRYVNKLIQKLIFEHSIRMENVTCKDELITLSSDDYTVNVEESLAFKKRTKKLGFN